MMPPRSAWRDSASAVTSGSTVNRVTEGTAVMLPIQEDYAAISEAFMETSRGRWFLGEYAKRNRNADTSMVLDAVARIEQSLAAQRQATAEAETGLAEAASAEARLAEAKLAEAK